MSGLAFENVVKTYLTAAGSEWPALRGISFQVEEGQRVAVVGRSGSGKSTLLHLAAGIDVPTSGRILVQGSDIGGLSDRQRTLWRRRHVGLVFQFFHLLSHLTVAENVTLNALIGGPLPAAARRRAGELLDRVGLGPRAGDRIDELSGGEQQRVALCRALLHHPSLILADEPTGNLDDGNADMVMSLLFEMTADEGATLVFATHSTRMAARADRSWRLHSGILDQAERDT